MDKDGLQRQQENMEEASERWRAERRRLNAEIDKLESALADAKSPSSRKRGGAGEKAPGIDPLAVAKLQEAADQKLKQTMEEWEGERAKLNSKITRLEGALAEAIARASNPLRVTQSVKEQFELELNRVAKEKNDLEQAFLRAKTEWEQEKLKVTGEMVKLRRAAQIMGRPVPKEDAPETNPKVRDLQNQLRENLAQSNAERERLVGQIQKMEDASREWDSERRKLSDHAGQLQQSLNQAEAKIQSLEIAARKPNAAKVQVEELKREKEGLQRETLSLQGLLKEARSALDAERQRTTSQIEQMEQQLQQVSDTSKRMDHEGADLQFHQYEQQLHDVTQQKTQLAAKLQNASTLLESERAVLEESRNAWDSERLHLNSQVEQLTQQLQQVSDTRDRLDNEVIDQLRQQYEQRLQEAIQQKTQLADQLQNATSRHAVRDRSGLAQASDSMGLDTEGIEAEISRVQGQLNEIVAIIENPNTELSIVIRKNVEKAELDSYLRGILFALKRK